MLFGLRLAMREITDERIGDGGKIGAGMGAPFEG